MDGQILSVVILFGAEAINKSRGPTQAVEGPWRGDLGPWSSIRSKCDLTAAAEIVAYSCSTRATFAEKRQQTVALIEEATAGAKGAQASARPKTHTEREGQNWHE
jgi:hypothetical protein